MKMTNGLDEDYVKIQKSELDELKSTIEEQKIVIEQTKGFAFGLESKNLKYLKRIDELKVDIKNQKKMYESSASWRITKPLRWFTNLFRR